MPLFDKSGGNSDKASRASKVLAGLVSKEGGPTPEELEAQKKAEEEQAAQKAADEAAAAKAAEEAAAQKAAEEAAAQQASDDEAAKKAAEEAAAKKAEEEAALAAQQQANKNKPETDPVKKELSEEELLSALSEKLGKSLNSFDELTSPAAPEVPEDIKQLMEWSKETGLPVAKWPEYNQDFTKLSDMDVAKRILSEKNPTFTKEELDYKMKEFVFDPEVDEDGDKIAKSIKLKEFAASGRQELEKNRLSLVESAQQKVLSPEVQEAIKIAEQVKAQEAATAQSNEQYLQNVTEASNALNAIDLNLTDELKIQFNLPGEVKNALPKMVAEMPHWYNDDGSLNHSEVVKDVAKATQFDSAVKAAFEQGVHYGKEGVIKKNNNVTIDRVEPQKDGEGTKKKGNAKEVVSKLAGGQNRRLRFRNANK